MILVSVGTSSPPFTRLLEAMAVIAPHLKDPVVVQRGKTEFRHDGMKIFDFIDEGRFRSMIRAADIVVTHGGFGILATLIQSGKKIVAVPRLEKYGEATNPQVELVEYLEQKGALVAVYNVAELYSALEKARSFESTYRMEIQRIPHLVRSRIRKHGAGREKRKGAPIRQGHGPTG